MFWLEAFEVTVKVDSRYWPEKQALFGIARAKLENGDLADIWEALLYEEAEPTINDFIGRALTKVVERWLSEQADAQARLFRQYYHLPPLEDFDVTPYEEAEEWQRKQLLQVNPMVVVDSEEDSDLYRSGCP